MTWLTARGNAADPRPRPFVCMYGHSDDRGVTDAFRKLVPRINVIEGTSTNAAFIRELRARDCIYAAHVTNPETATTGQLLARWRMPFDNTLGGRLPGGYDAIAIDELRSNPDGSVQSRRVCDALAALRKLYPRKQIYAAATWHLGREAPKYSQQLRAVHQHVDMLMLEVYLREQRPVYGYFASWADQLKSVEPGLLSKTVYGLGISQRGYLYDDSTSVGFFGHLDQQFHSIRTDPDASKMPGVMFWAYYRSETDVTPEYLARLVDHYYLKGNTGYFGDGKADQLVGNSQFETLSGWNRSPGDGGKVEQFRYDAVAGLQNDHDDHGWSSHGVHGLRMIRGRSPNRATYELRGLDPGWVYTVSAWVHSNKPGRRAAVRIVDRGGRVIAEAETRHAGRGTQWNEWSRVIFNFSSQRPRVRIELNDANNPAGTGLYWDFVELEEVFPRTPEKRPPGRDVPTAKPGTGKPLR